MHRSPPRALAVLAVVLALAALAAGCGGGSDGRANASGDGAVAVVATTTVLGDLARAVGGDAVDVTQLLAPNSDPHDYEPRPRDVLAAADAAVVLASGAGLDDWIEDVVAQVGGDARLVDVGATLSLEDGAATEDAAGADAAADEHGHDHGPTDPHWWHDPTHVARAATAVRDALIAAAPHHRATYAANATAYLERLETLDAGIRRCIAGVPPARRKLVADHDALGWFAARYGLEVVGTVIPSRSTQAQPSAGDVAALAREIEREGVPAVFPAAGASRKLAEAVAREAGVTVGRPLYGDALGPDGSEAATYLEMAAYNADAIVRGLTGGARRCAIDGR